MDSVIVWLLLAAFAGVVAAGTIALLFTCILTIRMWRDRMYGWSVFAAISGLLWAAIIFYGAGVVARAFMAMGG
jgi:hypothetical protein